MTHTNPAASVAVSADHGASTTRFGRNRRIRAIALTITAAALLLTGCGKADNSTDSDRSEVVENSPALEEHVKTLRDGRTITCIVYDAYKAGGISCDWNPTPKPNAPATTGQESETPHD